MELKNLSPICKWAGLGSTNLNKIKTTNCLAFQQRNVKLTAQYFHEDFHEKLMTWGPMRNFSPVLWTEIKTVRTITTNDWADGIIFLFWKGETNTMLTVSPQNTNFSILFLRKKLIYSHFFSFFFHTHALFPR